MQPLLRALEASSWFSLNVVKGEQVHRPSRAGHAVTARANAYVV
jgi:hypothetical protein